MTYAKAPPIEAAPASPIRLSRRCKIVNVLFWLQIRHHHTLIIPHHQSGKIGWRQRNVFMNESSFKIGKSDIRQGTTDRGSTSIADSVFSEVQRLQRVVLAANQTKTRLDKAPLSIRKNRVAPKKCLFEGKFLHKLKE